MNNVYLVIEILVAFSLLLMSKKLFGEKGIVGWMCLMTVIANIETLKQVTLLGIDTTLGTVLFASTFLATDMLTENYGEENAKKGVKMAIFSIICFTILMQLFLLYTPNSIDFSQDSMMTIFGFIPRITIASVIMYAIASMLNIAVFNKISKKTGGKYLWLRNNVSTIVCNCAENFGFAFLAFSGVYGVGDIISIAIGTSVIEILIALCDTPFLYLSKKI